MKLKLYLLASVIPCLFWVGLAQSAADDEALWLNAVKRFERGDYSSASVDLQGILSASYSNYKSSAHLLLAKCYLHQKHLDAAISESTKLISRFPHSRYVPHAYFLVGQVRFLKKDYYDAAWHLLIAAQTAREEDLKAQALEKLLGIYEGFLGPGQKEQLHYWVESDRIRSEMKRVDSGFRQTIKVGVILDLSGLKSQKGEALLQGIKLALSETRGECSVDVGLLVRDSNGNVLDAVQHAQDLIETEYADVLIGDLDGACSAAIAAVAADHHIPLLIPVARDQGLTRIGEGIFQLLPNYHLEGSAIGQYVFEDLEGQRTTILAPASTQGGQNVNGFNAIALQYGVPEPAVQWYYHGALSFKRQMDNLIEIGADSLVAQYELTEEDREILLEWDEDREDEELPEAGFLDMEVEEELTLVDSLLEVYVSPINYFDTFYIPCEGEDLLTLAPQIAATGFHGHLVGGANCLEYIDREENLRYVNGMIFPAVFETSDLTKLSAEAGQALRQLGAALSYETLLGYDAFQMLAEALREGGYICSYSITRTLEETHEFKVTRGSIYIPENTQVNHSIYILGFENGNFHLLKDSRIPNTE